MSTNPRVFTLEEANALLPRLRVLVASQLERREELEKRLETIAQRVGDDGPNVMNESPDDADDLRALKRDATSRLREYQTAWNELEEIGVVLKDARTGLLDFYARIDGKLVFLCWRYGEEAIAHYHDLESGFSSRKAIEGALRTRMYN